MAYAIPSFTNYKMKTKTFIFLGYFVFILYWITTIFFTIPENYLQIKTLKYEKVFSSILYQRWSFFAPPPQTNDRLYYEFVNHNKDTISIEVLKPLNDRRKKEYIFNSNSSVADYILSSSINTITDNFREGFKNYKSKNCNDILDDECHKEFIIHYSPQIEKMDDIKTLKNYGFLIGEKKINLNKYDKIKIILTSVNIPKFSERNLKVKKHIENKIFETSYYNYKTNKWEK